MKHIFTLMMILFSTALLWAGDDYLCFTAQVANSYVKLTKYKEPPAISLEYSKDTTTWQPYTINQKITLDTVGDKVYFRAIDKNANFNIMAAGGNRFYYFTMSGWINASGNIMSLLDKTCEQTWLPKSAFGALFQGCSALTSAPELPATTLSEDCYHNMFSGCFSLKTAPKLPATVMQKNCYFSMFGQCSALTTAPDLPATQLADSCYMKMFLQCTALEQAPDLPATDISYTDCYNKMFQNCKALQSVRVSFSAWDNSTQQWLDGVKSTGVLRAPCELPIQRGVSYIPDNWRFKCGKDTLRSDTLAHACDSMTWYGQTYYQSGEYEKTFVTPLDDDSIVTLHLTIHYSSVTDTTAVSCSSFVWGGTTYTESGIYQQVLTSPAGCDSVLILHLTIHQPTYTYLTDTICQGDTLLFNGQILTAAGLYKDTLMSANGCDSIVTLHLTIRPPKHTELTDTICEGDTIYFHGKKLTTAGQYQSSLISSEGCDSVVDLSLSVIQWPKSDFQFGDICANETMVQLDFGIPLPLGTSYQLVFDTVALRNGFVSRPLTKLDSQTIAIPFPVVGNNRYTEPNTYTAQLILTNAICSTPKIYPIRFTLLYPSSIMLRKWDDVIGVLNKDHNGGYQFSAYQWYLNDQPLPNGLTDVLYMEGGLPSGTYQVQVTRQSDGVTLMSCPYIHQSSASVAAKYIARVTPADMSNRDCGLSIYCNMPTTYRVINVFGQYIDQGTIEEGVTHIQVNSHLTIGSCIVQCESNQGDIITTKIISK